MIPEASQPTPTHPKTYRRGIRFQLSSLLLLSTLNAVALAGAVSVLFLALSDDVNSHMADIRPGINLILSVHDDLIVEGESAEEVDSRLVEAKDLFSALPYPTETLLSSIDSYDSKAQEWQDANTNEDIEADAQVQLKALTLAHRAVLGEISLLTAGKRPELVERILPMGRWFMAWILLMAVVTIRMALKIQQVLGQPLETLTSASAMVAAGNLDKEIPALKIWKGAPEILALSRSVEAMRQRLVHSIAALNERTDELGAVLNTLDEGVLVLDATGTIVEINPRAELQVKDRAGDGLSPRPGRTLRGVFPSLESPRPSEIDDADITFTTLSGRSRHLNLNMRRLPGTKQKNRAFLALIRDVTHEFELETLKRDFLSVVTHELKTPLTSIEGYAKLLVLGKGGGLSERQLGFARTITEQTAVLKEMIQTLLDITRIEGGNLPLNRESISAAACTSEAGFSMAGEAEAKGISLVIDEVPLKDARIYGDPFRIRQILGNLIGNAFKFTEVGGEVRVTGGIDGEQVWLSVEDTGRGIPEDAIPHLFEKFYQVEKADTRNKGGAGLGLYICHQLIKAHDGDISVTSEIGVGSRFTLTFPRLMENGQSTAHEDT